MNHILKKGVSLLLNQQSSILSAAYIIMATVIISQLLGLVRNRLLVSIFGASNTLGIYNYSMILPDTIFQLIIASAYASAFIPIFTQYLRDKTTDEAHRLASSILFLGLIVFGILSIVLIILAPNILQIFNLGNNFTSEQMSLMADLMRIVLFGQLFFIIGTAFAAMLQSYNHFFIPGIAAAFYNLGIIIGIILLHNKFGIYSAAFATSIGGILFILVQIPLLRKLGYKFRPKMHNLLDPGVKKIIKLMTPRSIQNAIQQIGTVGLAAIISFMVDPGRQNLLFDYAKILMFAPVSLVGFSVAQAAFPVLARKNNNLEDFKSTFLSSLNQILYLILPISALLLVLRIPIVRLIYGADRFDWDATIITASTLAFFSLSIFAQALIGLCYRAFYALHDSKIPLITSIVGTVSLLIFSYIAVMQFGFGITSIALSFSIANIIQFGLLMIILHFKTNKFNIKPVAVSFLKIFTATSIMAIALYIPIKLLDQLVLDTTKTVNLIILTGISCFFGFVFYFFCTWLLKIKEAYVYLNIIKSLGNWKDILGKSEETIDATRTTT